MGAIAWVGRHYALISLGLSVANQGALLTKNKWDDKIVGFLASCFGIVSPKMRDVSKKRYVNKMIAKQEGKI